MKQLINKIKLYLKQNLDLLVNRDWESIRVDWYSNTDNVGDILNSTLVRGLTGKKIIQVSAKTYNYPHYFVIGSLLDRANSQTVVWGSGFISAESKCASTPKKVCAVRGPKTRARLLDLGIDCPEVYGDPALLMPKIFNPKIKKSYKLGIVPHYVDKDDPILTSLAQSEDVIIIDIQDPNPYNFLVKLMSCEAILSSSLHGVILSDAYNIPAQWVRLSDKLTGGSFKFQDYYQSVHRQQNHFEMPREALVDMSSLDEIVNYIGTPQFTFDTQKLIDACPFELNLQLPYSER